MDPELETLEASFNSRIEQWISKQGLLFQFTHDTGSGTMFAKLCGLFFRLLILCLIGLIVFWFYLTKRPSSAAFRLDVEKSIAIGLNAQEVEISNISRAKGGLLSGEMRFSNLALGETETSFFEDWYVKEEDVSVVGRKTVLDKQKSAAFYGVTLKPLGIGDNYFSSKWSAKEINVLKMELKLKTGADTDELAMAGYSTLFKDFKNIHIDTIQIFDATLLWGHSETSAGSIKNAQLDLTRGEGSWEINITGGTFSHGWLKDASINNMKVICKSSGEVLIESASLSLGEGSLKFNASIQMKAQPEITGTYSFNDIEVIDLIGDAYENWLGGSIDGEGVLSGNFNTAEGIKTRTTIPLTGSSRKIADQTSDSFLNGEKDSVIIIRGDQFSLLKLMQMKDPRNSYSLLRAHKGKLIVESQGKDTEVSLQDVRCGQNDLILINGKFDYAIRTNFKKEEEIDASSLKLSSAEKEVYEQTVNEKTIESLGSGNTDTVRAFSGNIKLGMIPEVFENNIKVLETYPVDTATLRVWFNIDLKGQLDELTEELSDKLYDTMKDDENK